MKLTGPYQQIVTLANLSLRGKIDDEDLEIVHNGGIVTDGDKILKIGLYKDLLNEFPAIEIDKVEGSQVAVPAFVDSHTHICFAGNRANDFAMRNGGKSYLEIAESGGGIWSSVKHTRSASQDELIDGILKRIHQLMAIGITTIEIKSGYGLNLESELKMLRAIKEAQKQTETQLIPTCLSAHLMPKDFEGTSEDYLNYIITEILPQVKKEQLANRVDIFIEKSAFVPEESKVFLEKAKSMGFDLTVHADQFTSGSSRIAVEVGAKSADHLEATSEDDIGFLAKSETVATALPGASVGLGEPFTPARKLLDANGILAIASDWNPGSAPMGNLLVQASILATYEKLSTAEVLAGITYRSAHALGLSDRGRLEKDKKADWVSFPTDNFQNIIYHQGTLKPNAVYINAKRINL